VNNYEISIKLIVVLSNFKTLHIGNLGAVCFSIGRAIHNKLR